MSNATNKKAAPSLATAVSMATTKPVEKKAPAKKTTAKKAAPAPKVKALTLHATSDKAAPYSVMHNQIAKAAYTAAILVHAGYMTLGKSGNPLKAKGKGNVSILRTMMGASAFGYWKRGELIKGEEITVAGLNKVTSRLDNTAPAYRTELQAIRDMVEAMQKGGQVEAGGEKVTLARKVEITA